MLEGYFWYSAKQFDMLLHNNYCQLDNGEVVHYTEMNDKNKPSGKWDDYKYLGHGKYHHTTNQPLIERRRREKMETGIFIRAQIDGKWDSVDIGDPRLSDEEVFKWLRSRGGKNEFAERCVMVLLERNQDIVDRV